MACVKGYPIATGYMGYVPWYGRYMLFETEDAYYEYINEDKGDENEDTNKDHTASE